MQRSRSHRHHNPWKRLRFTASGIRVDAVNYSRANYVRVWVSNTVLIPRHIKIHETSLGQNSVSSSVFLLLFPFLHESLISLVRYCIFVYRNSKYSIILMLILSALLLIIWDVVEKTSGNVFREIISTIYRERSFYRVKYKELLPFRFSKNKLCNRVEWIPI